jgi:hypothetical protein
MMLLQPGDILAWCVTPDAPLVGRMIGWAERQLGDQKGDAAYYHVAIVSQNITEMYASRPPKIDLYPTPLPLPNYIELHRLRIAPDSDQLKAVFSYAESRRGRPYDFLGVLTVGNVEMGGLEFCSKYVLDCFAEAQIVLAPNVQFPTPDDIGGSDLTYVVGNV